MRTVDTVDVVAAERHTWSLMMDQLSGTTRLHSLPPHINKTS